MLKINPLTKPKIIAIIGPTASGKSDLAIRIGRKFNGEIISADSRQVYKGMHIGTGKVTKKEQKLIPHHLLDIASPKKQFTVSDFKTRATKTIKNISKKNKTVIVCGGTGFYIDSLLYDLDLPEVPPNKKLRTQLEKLSSEKLFQKLKKLDSVRAKTIDARNPRRLIRAIEIATALGKNPIIQKKSPYQVLWLGLNPKNLTQRISKRLSARLKQGMVAEVKKLHNSGVSWKRLDDFGLEYRWTAQYLRNKITKKELKKGLEHAINQYAKCQMTWFKKNQEINWIKDRKEAERLVKKLFN